MGFGDPKPLALNISQLFFAVSSPACYVSSPLSKGARVLTKLVLFYIHMHTCIYPRYIWFFSQYSYIIFGCTFSI